MGERTAMTREAGTMERDKLLWKKIVRVGTTDVGEGEHVSVYVKIEYRKAQGRLRLSFTGVEGPRRNGDAYGASGQISKPKVQAFAPGWDEEKVDRLWSLWDRWHLNDMRPGCEHVKREDAEKELELTPLTWGPKYVELRNAAEEGTMPLEEYRTWGNTVKLVNRLVRDGFNRKAPKHHDLWGAEGEWALTQGLVKYDTSEFSRRKKLAGWVYPSEHPEGMLCKPCPVCGYRYGTAWRYEPVPEDVLNEIRSLPDADIAPAWI